MTVASDSLRIVASRGFRPEDLEAFAVIRRGESTCGTALERGERVVVGDVTASPIFAGKPILGTILAAGIRALQSTPLISRSGRLVGMLSTHFRSPRSPAERDLRILDLLARQAADWIERTQAEAALRESEARFRNMADHAPVMIWVTDPTGACSYVNERWCDFTGTPPEESFDFGWLDSVHPDDREKAGSAFRSANARSEAFRVEYRLRRHDGAYRWVIDSAAPRFAPDGAVPRVYRLGPRRHGREAGRGGDPPGPRRAGPEGPRADGRAVGGARGPRAAGGGPQGAAPAGRDGPGGRAAADLPRAARPDGPAAHGPDAPPAAGQGRRRARTPPSGNSSGGWRATPPGSAGTSIAWPWSCAPRRSTTSACRRRWRNYADEWSRRSGVAAELRVNGLGEGRLPPLVETAIYRAVQEAMTNVLKHAGATRVVVTLNRLKDSVSVIIEDDGRGFDAEAAMESDSPSPARACSA